MKKIVSVILVLSALFCFAACDKLLKKKESSTTEPTASTAPSSTTASTAASASTLDDSLLEGYKGTTDNGSPVYTYDRSGYNVLSKFPLPEFGIEYSISDDGKTAALILTDVESDDAREYIDSLAGKGFTVNASGTEPSSDIKGSMLLRASDKSGKTIEVTFYKSTTIEGPQMYGYLKIACTVK